MFYNKITIEEIAIIFDLGQGRVPDLILHQVAVVLTHYTAHCATFLLQVLKVSLLLS